MLIDRLLPARWNDYLEEIPKYGDTDDTSGKTRRIPPRF